MLIDTFSGTKRGLFVAQAMSILLIALPHFASAQEIDPRDRLDYAGVVLEPGDVISFQGGGATTGGFLAHGHASMYLGFDRQTQHQIFLDFSVTKGGIPEMIFGSPSGFHGRIMAEREFLTYNARWHPSFDVYRLQDRSTLDRRKLFREAKRIAATKSFGFSFVVCSSAVSKVLSAATGRGIDVLTPDGFASAPFIKHPGQQAGPTEINLVLRQLGRINPSESQPAAASGFLARVAGETRGRSAAQRERAEHEAEIRVPDTSAEDSARRAKRLAAWQYLQATVQLACADPDNLRSLRDHRKTWGVLISRTIVESFFKRDRESITPCGQQLMTTVLHSAGPVDVKWVEKQGRRHYKAEQQRVRREQEAAARLARAAEAARAEYVEAETRLAASAGGSSGSLGRATRGAAYRQLVAIAGGNNRIFDGR